MINMQKGINFKMNDTKKLPKSFREILNRECKKDSKDRFRTSDVISVAERTYNEQQAIISALKNHLNSITKVEK